MVEKHFSIRIVPVQSRGGLLINKSSTKWCYDELMIQEMCIIWLVKTFHNNESKENHAV
jgi:hypothetical protein